MIGRRSFLLMGAAVAMPSVVRAQTGIRIAVLTPGPTQWSQAIFMSELERLGRRVGEGFAIDVVSAAGRLDRLTRLATDIADRRPQVIVAVNTPATRAMASATRTIPIVAGIVGDPIGAGFAKTLSKPGGNITGVSNLSGNMTSKRTAILLELVPGASRIALFLHPDDPIKVPQLRDIEAQSGNLGIETRAFPMRSEAELPRALDTARAWKAQGLVRLAGQAFAIGAATARLATEWRLPSMMTQRSDVAAGGLVSYFADHKELWRRAAAQVDAILKGQAPGELPFEQPRRFELVVNIKTARLLGLTIPPSVLVSADEVIE